MSQYRNEEVSRESNRRYLLMRMVSGARNVYTNHNLRRVVICYLVVSLIIWIFRKPLFIRDQGSMFQTLDVLTELFLTLLIPVISIAGLLFFVIFMGTPLRYARIRNSFYRIGLMNKAGEVPLLIKESHLENSNIVVLEFEACGIPRDKWEDKRADLEAELDVYIVKISEGSSRRRIELQVVPADQVLSENIYWDDKNLIKESFVLVIGESVLGQETVNIARVPHILLGGSTGSGKSVLLKLLLMQCIKKEAEVYIADFKGGVDFSDAWRACCELIIETDVLLEKLTNITSELERRKVLFRNSGASNLDDYNRNNGDLKRIIFACDEVAEILDKTGQQKVEKERIASIENRLSTIARQGRAFGIHLILATQRPDANILAGQIRNNMDCRICGRADNVLSQIILDNTSAADAIEKDAQGRFITGDGTIFQGYLFDETKAFVIYQNYNEQYCGKDEKNET